MNQFLEKAKIAHNHALCDLASDYWRKIANVRLLNSTALPFCCIEIAALQVAAEYSKEYSIRCAATTPKVYERTFDMAVKLLGIKSTTDLRTLCTAFGYEKWLPAFEQARQLSSQADDVAALFVAVCQAAGLSHDMQRVCRLTFQNKKQLAASVKALAPLRDQFKSLLDGEAAELLLPQQSMQSSQLQIYSMKKAY